MMISSRHGGSAALCHLGVRAVVHHVFYCLYQYSTGSSLQSINGDVSVLLLGLRSSTMAKGSS